MKPTPCPRSWGKAQEATASWVHWYNHQRLHSSIGDVPPVEYEQAHYDSTQGPDNPVAA